jgi:type IV pilus assembly protein PilC
MPSKGDKAAGGIKRVKRGPRKPAAQKAAETTPPPAPKRAAVETVGATRASAPPPRAATSVLGNFGVQEHVTTFLRQLIMMLEAGTPLLKTLNTLANRGESSSARAVVADIARHVEEGNALWQAFERHPRYFDPVVVNLIKASEASGTLVTVLKRIVVYREKRRMLQRRVTSALLYPVVVAAVCVLAVFVIAQFVLPQFVDFFDKLDVAVPWYTTAFINTIETITSMTFIIVGVAILVGLGVLYKVLVSQPLWRLRVDRLKLKIPKIGPSIYKKVAVVEFTRNLSLLLGSGMSMMVTLDLVRRAIHNQAMANVLQSVRDSVERGAGIEEPLRQQARVVPPVVTDMLVTGEESGQLDDIANHIAETYEEEVNITIAGLGEIIQPVLTVFLGGAVLIVALALLMPMINMIQTLGSAG